MNMPILVVDEFSFTARMHVEAGLTWSHESLWCKLIRFARWNRLDAGALCVVFGHEILLDDALVAPAPALRRRLQHYLWSDRRALRDALPSVTSTNAPQQLSRVLRGCPLCAGHGFHSALYQLQFIQQCPIHGIPLATGCSSCGLPQPYSVNDRWTRTGPICQGCGRAMLRRTCVDADILVPLLRRLTRWQEWIEERNVAIRHMTTPAAECRAAEAVWMALAHWNRQYLEAMPAINQATATGGIVPDIDATEIVNEAALLQTAAAHYYRRRRLWQRRLRRCHRRRVNDILAYRTPVSSTCSHAPNLLALVLWRLTWERLASSAGTHLWSNKDALPSGITSWILTRPGSQRSQDAHLTIARFDQALVDSYCRCEHLAAWMQCRGGLIEPIWALQALLPSPRYRGRA